MILRIFLVACFASTVSADFNWRDLLPKGFHIVRSALTPSSQNQTSSQYWPKQAQKVPQNLFVYQTGAPYTKKNIDNLPKSVFKIEQDRAGRPILFQKYSLDNQVVIKYLVLPQAQTKQRYRFPQDFMVEVPSVWMTPHRSKSLAQVAVLGTHNCFANPVDGFLYFQQQNSIRDQFEHGGVRMLRPAWHNPSGSVVDAPNREPILCHADDDKCATASLATRGFRPHKAVKEFNQLLMDLLKKHPKEVVIVCINNYLTAEKTDAEIEKIPHLADMVFTLSDLHNKKYQTEWNGHHWPTLDWMLRNNKRVVFINDISTRYTIEYDTYVRRNQYGTASIAVASKSRSSLKSQGNELVELSWFQNVSLPLHEINALKVSVELYLKVMTAVPSVFAQAFGIPQSFFGFQRAGSSPQIKNLQNFIDVMSVVRNKATLLLSVGIPLKLLSNVQESFPALKKAIHNIEEYVPVKQDNSLDTLVRLVRACRTTGVLVPSQIPNIIMLDFATTTGDGIVMVNLINMLMDQKLQLNYVGIGGFCYREKQISTQGII